ncbi:MAG: TadE/TadG family type IV pilus assembly protein [Thermomicrobiales bacterium]
MIATPPARYRTRRSKTHHQARRGQSLVELALLLPLLALLLLGAIDLGRAFFAYNRLTNSVEAGALFGIRYYTFVNNGDNPDPNNITAVIQHESANSSNTVDSNIGGITVKCYVGRTNTLRGPNGDCDATNADGTPVVQSGDTMVVTATYNFQPFTGQIIRIVGTNFMLSKTVQMVVL